MTLCKASGFEMLAKNLHTATEGSPLNYHNQRTNESNMHYHSLLNEGNLYFISLGYPSYLS